MPFDNARSTELVEGDGPDLSRALTAIAGFDSSHPYLLFDQGALAGIRAIAGRNPGLRARFEPIPAQIGPPAPAPQDRRTAIKRQARRLIDTSFIALVADNAQTGRALAAAREMLAGFAAAASWKERPVIKSFLDCAEIAVAVALAYDWLYDRLSPAERLAIERAIARNVLEPALAAYEDRALLWPRRRDNCTLVSNSGILIAALAVLRTDRALAAELVHRSLASSWNVFAALAPDGAWREGLSYWSLAMRYAGLLVAALESTLGSSFGLADRPGLAQTGDFALHAVGPFGEAFNFGDSARRFDASPLAWVAHRFGRPIDGWLVGEPGGRHLAFATIWPQQAASSPAALDLPTGKVFVSGDLACFRNTWSSDPRARPVYLAIKGGNIAGRARAPPAPEDVLLHAQADAGTFIVDGARHRWVIDLGPDDYDLPGYFDHGRDGRSGPRWKYYRSQAAGHNTLVIGGRDQVPNAPAAIVGSCTDGDCKWVVLDLSAAYGEPEGAVRRGAALLGRQVVIQDEVGPGVSPDILWAIHTSAEPVTLSGSVARFRLGSDNLVARILEPAAARFELAALPPPRSFALSPAVPLHGLPPSDSARVSELARCEDAGGGDAGRERAAGAAIRRLQIAWPTGARRLTVLLLPDCDGAEAMLPVTPLDHWLARRPVRLAGLPRRGQRNRGLPDIDPGIEPGIEPGIPVASSTAKAGHGWKTPQMRLDHA